MGKWKWYIAQLNGLIVGKFNLTFKNLFGYSQLNIKTSIWNPIVEKN